MNSDKKSIGFRKTIYLTKKGKGDIIEKLSDGAESEAKKFGKLWEKRKRDGRRSEREPKKFESGSISQMKKVWKENGKKYLTNGKRCDIMNKLS